MICPNCQTIVECPSCEPEPRKMPEGCVCGADGWPDGVDEIPEVCSEYEHPYEVGPGFEHAKDYCANCEHDPGCHKGEK